jgi:hypothetical protein
MATVPREHARLAAFVDGTYLIELTSITFGTESGQIRVDTFEGLAGFTPGSGKTTVKLELAVPISGQEFPFQETCADGTLLPIQIPVGQKSFMGIGKLMDVEISQSVNAAASESVTWEGGLSKLQ